MSSARPGAIRILVVEGAFSMACRKVPGPIALLRPAVGFLPTDFESRYYVVKLVWDRGLPPLLA